MISFVKGFIERFLSGSVDFSNALDFICGVVAILMFNGMLLAIILWFEM